jgi:hypothetical protein
MRSLASDLTMTADVARADACRNGPFLESDQSVISTKLQAFPSNLPFAMIGEGITDRPSDRLRMRTAWYWASRQPPLGERSPNPNRGNLRRSPGRR